MQDSTSDLDVGIIIPFPLNHAEHYYMYMNIPTLDAIVAYMDMIIPTFGKIIPFLACNRHWQDFTFYGYGYIQQWYSNTVHGYDHI